MTVMALTISSAFSLTEVKPGFTSAQPIWPAGRETDKNLFVGFRAAFDLPDEQKVILRVTASSVYRAFVDGRFAGYGPARGPHGFFRVDEWDLTPTVTPGTHVVALEVAGYNVDNYYLPNQPAFLQAEIVAGDKILASTAGQGARFEAFILTERVQKVQRYSFQRPFTEVYRLQPDYDRWRKDMTTARPVAECAALPVKQLLPRRVPYPDFALRQAVWQVATGTMKGNLEGKDPEKIKAFAAMGLQRGGFGVDEQEATPAVDLQKTASDQMTPIDKPFSWNTTLTLGPKSFSILDLGTNLTGFIGARVTCRKPTRLFVTFGEILSDGDVDFTRGTCASLVTYDLLPGTYDLESFEPYTLRYLKLIVLDGQCDVEHVYLREYVNPDVWQTHFTASDERLNRLFAAARETFRQNALDIFMDCPSRERAGWLCDSFFTARVAMDLSGNTVIERNFYENFLLPRQFADMPPGMLPMCYPADHRTNSFIPNWALWFVVELEEYLQRSGDRRMLDALKPKVLALFDYFKGFRNEDGLLENLEGWVFIEWSEANKFVQNVNYPSNMLYAAALQAAGRLYDLPELAADAERIRQVIRQQSFDGEFFVDNAVRQDGKLEVTRNRTETCQYYAFFFNVATPQTHGPLWQRLCEQFGPKRNQTKAFADVPMANAFIGNVLRLEILSRYGRCRQILDESIDYHLYMADRTGTLWENVHAGASCNHGFASHVAHLLYRDVLGLHRFDPVNKTIQLRFADLPLDWCEGRVPTADGGISLRWWRDQGRITYRIDAPAGYTLQAENLTGKELIQRP